MIWNAEFQNNSIVWLLHIFLDVSETIFEFLRIIVHLTYVHVPDRIPWISLLMRVWGESKSTWVSPWVISYVVFCSTYQSIHAETVLQLVRKQIKRGERESETENPTIVKRDLARISAAAFPGPHCCCYCCCWNLHHSTLVVLKEEFVESWSPGSCFFKMIYQYGKKRFHINQDIFIRISEVIFDDPTIEPLSIYVHIAGLWMKLLAFIGGKCFAWIDKHVEIENILWT